jgi:hypothetical protein
MSQTEAILEDIVTLIPFVDSLNLSNNIRKIFSNCLLAYPCNSQSPHSATPPMAELLR